MALIAAGWRKPARASAAAARGRHPVWKQQPLPVEEVEAEVYRPAPVWRRLFDLVAGSVMSVVLGMALATVLGYGAAWVVIKLSDLLKR